MSVTLRNNEKRLIWRKAGWKTEGQQNHFAAGVLPPVQRIDAMMNGQVKIQALPDIHTLPSDRESLFYYNVREIPPKSGKPTPCKLLQTRIKLFWRPKALED
ncbi:MAG: fimbria/pilus periplasmic chaperone [Escherichia coli]